MKTWGRSCVRSAGKLSTGALLSAAMLVAPGTTQSIAAPSSEALSGAIPPPDESHAMHKIDVCGARHFDPRLELCDTRDDHIYRHVRIGTQTWMAENLNYGTAIPGSQNQTRAGQKYCLHDATADCAALYQWAEAAGVDPSFNAKRAALKGRVQGACPHGWHLPSAAEWATLIALVDKEQGKANEAMSLMYFSHDPNFQWKTNTNPDGMLPSNRYGFEVISTGVRVLQGSCPVGQSNQSYFCNAHDRAMFWTSDDNSADGDPATAVDYSFTEDIPQVGVDNIAHDPAHKCDPQRFGVKGCAWKAAQKVYGMAVRCIEDDADVPREPKIG